LVRSRRTAFIFSTNHWQSWKNVSKSEVEFGLFFQKINGHFFTNFAKPVPAHRIGFIFSTSWWLDHVLRW